MTASDLKAQLESARKEQMFALLEISNAQIAECKALITQHLANGETEFDVLPASSFGDKPFYRKNEHYEIVYSRLCGSLKNWLEGEGLPNLVKILVVNTRTVHVKILPTRYAPFCLLTKADDRLISVTDQLKETVICEDDFADDMEIVNLEAKTM